LSKKRKKPTPCKWLRNHSGQTKPTRLGKVIDTEGKVYIYLNNGMLVHERTAQKMGV
jgi:hypothetical protein